MRCTIEWAMIGDGALLRSGAFKGFLKGSWSREDASYGRPLNLDDDSVERW
jgi:hypothetical protein